MHYVSNAANWARQAWPGDSTVTQRRIDEESGASGGRDATAHAGVLGNPFAGITGRSSSGSRLSSLTRSTVSQGGSSHENRSGRESSDSATRSGASSRSVRGSGSDDSSGDPSEARGPVLREGALDHSIAYRLSLGGHAARNFVREGTCQFAGRVPALLLVGWAAKELMQLSPVAAVAVFGAVDLAITVGNHWYLTRLRGPGGRAVDDEEAVPDEAREAVRPSGDSLTFKCVQVMAIALPLIAVPVFLSGAGYADGHEMSDEMMWNLTSVGPECALNYGLTGGPWAYGAHLAMTRVLQPIVVGKVARVLRQLVQSLTRSPITSGCVVGYELADGSFERLTDHDQQKLNALRDSPYCLSTFVLLYCCSTWVTGLSDSIDGALCATMIELGLDLNNPVWGAINEGFDGAFPVLSGLLFSNFPEWFGASSETAHLIRCRVDRQPSFLDGWQDCIDDFRRHASIRLTTGAAGADFPSVLAGLLDLSGVTWLGQVVRAVLTLWTGTVCATRARYLANWVDPSNTPRPGGLSSLALGSFRESLSSLSGVSRDQKPMTPREKRIKEQVEACTPRGPSRPHKSSSSTSCESSSSSSDDSPV